jgi:hypothetical protein
MSSRGLCDELIARPEEFYRLWCVVVCDLENLKNEEAITRVGSQRHKKKNSIPVEIFYNALHFESSCYADLKRGSNQPASWRLKAAC